MKSVFLVICVFCVPVLTAQAQVTITTTSPLPSGAQGAFYSLQLMATPTSKWTLISGALPAGISLSTDGGLTGTPVTAGTFNFTVSAAAGNASAQQSFQLVIAQSMTITTLTLASGAPGTPYSQPLMVAGGTGPFVWSITSGSLPPGLNISVGNGTISGTPTANSPGSYTFAVQVMDSSMPQLTTSKNFTLTIIQPTLAITTNSPLPLGVAGVFYLQQLAASGPSPQTWSVTLGILPPGLGLTTTGSLGGVPSVPGTFDFTVQATGGATAVDPLQTATKQFEIMISPALAITSVTTLPDATLGASYSVTLTAMGGQTPYSWTIPGRGLPPGLSISAAGVISGTPTNPGSFSFTVQLSDSFNPVQTTTRTFSIVVVPTITITTTSLPDAIRGVAYSQQLQSTGLAPVTWTISSGTVPAGMTLTAAGLVQGMPTTVGSQTFSVLATDARGATAMVTLTLAVDPPLPALSIQGLPSSLTPTQSADVNLTFASPVPGPLSGQLVLTFTSRAEVPADDPATQFSTGTRSVSFTVAANATTAAFASAIKLLTGTVTGTVTIVANFDNGLMGVPVATADISSTAPQLTSVTMVRTALGFDVQIVGYAPARRVTTVDFTFDVKNGSKVTQVPLSRSVDADFANWYRSPGSVPFGSTFSFLQSFTVSGNSSVVQDVTVRLSNAQGSTTSAVIKPQ
jgi:hypothetical protein